MKGIVSGVVFAVLGSIQVIGCSSVPVSPLAPGAGAHGMAPSFEVLQAAPSLTTVEQAIVAYLERRRRFTDYYPRVLSITVSPTPTGDRYTYRARVRITMLFGQPEQWASGTYDPATGRVTETPGESLR